MPSLRILILCVFVITLCLGLGPASAALITGTPGNDSPLNGTAFDDTILGLGGLDQLFELEGNDTLNGGAGQDELTGGAGADVFAFSLADVGTGIDRVLDFSLPEGDRIDLSDYLTAFNPSAHAIEDFVRITQSGVNSVIAVDTNGGGNSFQNVAVALNTSGLTDEQALINAGVLVVTPVPLPSALLLFGSGIMGLAGVGCGRIRYSWK
jgi:hypothetical protein